MKNINRSQLLAQAVTKVDDFTALRYVTLRGETPRLPQLEENGSDILPNIQSALLDVYHSLWAMEPSLKANEEVSPSHQYWRQMLESAVQTTAYQQMHVQTQLQELPSLIGTITMGQSFLEMVPEEDREQLKQQAEAQAEADAAQQQMQQAQAQANIAEQLLAQLQQAMGIGQPSEQAQQATEQLQSQMQQSQAKAQEAQMTLEEAKAKAEALAQQMLGKPGSEQAQKKQTQISRIAQQAATNAAKEVKEVSDLLQSWGMDPGELTREGMPKAIDIVQRMRTSKEFQKFKDLLGRMRQIAQRKAKSKQRSEGTIVSRIEYGRDISRAEKSEILNLVAHPVTRLKTLQRWGRGELRLVKQERKRKQKLGKGPIVICEDGSESMRGEKKLWSKAVCLALAYYAKLEKRTFVWIHFGSKTSRLIVRIYPNGQMNAEQMLEIAETFLSSGTDFEVPLSKAIEVIREENLKEADIALLTDGDCAVTGTWLKKFLSEKAALEVNLISILMDVGQTSKATVQEFSDQVETVSSFTAEEAGQKVLNKLR